MDAFSLKQQQQQTSQYVGFEAITQESEVKIRLAYFACDLFGCKMSGLQQLLLVFKERFITALKYAASSDKRLLECLSYLEAMTDDIPAAKDMKSMNLKFYFSHSLDLYLIMLNGSNDHVLVRLGNKMNLPRGCVLLWKQNRSIDFRGFFPKFENDKIKETEFDMGLLEGASTLSFFKKWSGYLLHIIAFGDEGGRYYWTVCSKKSADQESKYIQWGRAIMEPKISDELVQILADQHMYVGGEVMTPDDVHGYRAREKCVIVTCVGQGTFAHLSAPEKNVGHGRLLMHYLTSDKVWEFAQQYGLDCDSPITVKNSLVEFVGTVLKDRDGLTDSQFERNLKQFQQKKTLIISVQQGSVTHQRVVGDILEGFVFNIFYTDSTKGKKTVKVKLPYYTWRTMFLREMIQKHLVGKTDEEEPLWLCTQTRTRIEDFAERWCCTEEGKERFQRMMKCAIFQLSTLPESEYGQEGYHVLLADYVEKMYNTPQFQQMVTQFDIMVPPNGSTQEPITVCMVLGPVGAGKSSLMRRLVALDPLRFQAVDGDQVGGALTQQLGAERNPTTFFRIYEAILQHKIPVISHGGGAFVKGFKSNPKTCFLKESLRKAFGTRVIRLVTVLVDIAPKDTAQRVTTELTTELLEGLYKRMSEADVGAVVRARVERGESGWPALKNEKESAARIAKIYQLSLANAANAQAIVNDSDCVFVASSGTVDMGLILAELRGAPTDITAAAFDQVRAVLMADNVKDIDKASHITLYFRDAGDERPKPLAYIRGLERQIGQALQQDTGAMPATLYTLYLQSTAFDASNGDHVKNWTTHWKKVVLALPRFEIKDRPYLHITEETSIFAGKDMVKVAQWLTSSDDNDNVLELNDSKNPQARYILRRQPAQTLEYAVYGTKTKSVDIPETVFSIPVSYTLVGVVGFQHSDS